MKPDWTAVPYRDGTLAILVPRGHALARRSGHGFDALLDHDIVGLHAGAAAQEQMRERAQALGRTLNARMQVHGFDAIAQLVEAGLGVAVLPAAVAHRFAKVFRVQPLKLNEGLGAAPLPAGGAPPGRDAAVAAAFRRGAGTGAKPRSESNVPRTLSRREFRFTLPIHA